MNKYSKKENYISNQLKIDSTFWKNGIAMVLINQYKGYFKNKVADFGCGCGIKSAIINNLIPEIKEIKGFDINLKALQTCEKEVFPQIKNNKIKLCHTNLNEINHPSEYFDFAFSFHVLEHVYEEDINDVVKEMVRLLKPGASILINMPDKNSYLWEETHVYHPDKEELNSLFEKNNCLTIESYEDERGGQKNKSKNITALYQKKE